MVKVSQDWPFGAHFRPTFLGGDYSLLNQPDFQGKGKEGRSLKRVLICFPCLGFWDLGCRKLLTSLVEFGRFKFPPFLGYLFKGFWALRPFSFFIISQKSALVGLTPASLGVPNLNPN